MPLYPPAHASRRAFAMGAVAAAGCLATPWPSLAAAPALPPDRIFAIFREGDEIGRHAVRFSTNDAGMTVATDIDIAVKVGFLTVFRYEQRARARWVDGQLVDSRVAIKDNGEDTETLIRARGDDLAVEGGVANRVVRVPLGTMPDIAFWNAAIVRQRSLIDLREAQLTDVAARHKGSEKIDVAGQIVEAERFEVKANTGRHGDVWFDAASNWVKGVITTRGEKLDYRLVG